MCCLCFLVLISSKQSFQSSKGDISSNPIENYAKSFMTVTIYERII